MVPMDGDETGRGASEEPDATDHGGWFYVQHGEIYGPVSSVDLCAAAHLGFLGPDDLVRRADKSNWTVARQIRGLFKAAG
jgi:hypothetical protein